MNAKILIADDESDIVSMLGNFFESKGFRVLPAFNGAEALKQVEKQPDIILLDINMPGTDGLEVCKRIKRLLITGNPFVPVGNTATAPFTVLHPGLEHRTNFVAGIFGVPLVHNVQKGRKVVVCWIGTVYIIIDGNEPNTF